jgi:nitrite reductase/ring-hydroxylating ferredoxin subunit
VLAVRHGDAVQVLADHCAHLGGPLHQGRISGVGGDACVTCPWHGSTFRLSDGAVLHGPTTARQPALEARVSDSGQGQVRATQGAKATRPHTGQLNRRARFPRSLDAG